MEIPHRVLSPALRDCERVGEGKRKRNSCWEQWKYFLGVGNGWVWQGGQIWWGWHCPSAALPAQRHRDLGHKPQPPAPCLPDPLRNIPASACPAHSMGMNRSSEALAGLTYGSNTDRNSSAVSPAGSLVAFFISCISLSLTPPSPYPFTILCLNRSLGSQPLHFPPSPAPLHSSSPAHTFGSSPSRLSPTQTQSVTQLSASLPEILMEIRE